MSAKGTKKGQNPFRIVSRDIPVNGMGSEWREFAHIHIDGVVIDRNHEGEPLAVEVAINGRRHVIRLSDANQALTSARGVNGIKMINGKDSGTLVICLQASTPPSTKENKIKRAEAYIDSLMQVVGLIGTRKWCVEEPARSETLPAGATPRNRDY